MVRPKGEETKASAQTHLSVGIRFRPWEWKTGLGPHGDDGQLWSPALVPDAGHPLNVPPSTCPRDDDHGFCADNDYGLQYARLSQKCFNMLFTCGQDTGAAR